MGSGEPSWVRFCLPAVMENIPRKLCIYHMENSTAPFLLRMDAVPLALFLVTFIQLIFVFCFLVCLLFVLSGSACVAVLSYPVR